MALSNLFKREKTLYFPGCLTKGIFPELMNNYKEIFNKLRIDFILLSEQESCCGIPIINGGYKKDARKLAKKNFELFKKNRITKIITNCPSCYHAFKSIYPTLVRDWNIEVEHATVTILKALEKKKIRFKGNEEKPIVTYHDSCHLARFSKITEEPRKVIELLGGELREFKLNRNNAMCCGAGGGVRSNFPEIAKKAASIRTKSAPKDSKNIISACSLCYANLKSATDKSQEFSTFVLGRLNKIL